MIVDVLEGMLDANAFSTEALHSKNLRHKKQRIFSPHIDVPHLAAWHQQRAGRRWCSQVLSHVEKAPCQAGQIDKPAPKRRKRGSGGAWRAFLHDREAHGVARGKFQEGLSHIYNNLSPNTKQKYVKMGQDATRVGKLGGKAFGSMRASSSGKCPSSVTRLASVLELHLALGVSPSTSEIEAFIAQPTCPLSQHALDVLAKALVYRLREAKKEEGFQKTWVEETLEGLGAAHSDVVRDMLAVTPALEGVRSLATRQPHGDVLYLNVVAKELELASVSTRGSASDWERLHVGLQATAMREEAAAARISNCCKAGVCMCTAEGRLSSSLYVRSWRILKAALPNKTQWSERVLAGLVLLRWSPTDEQGLHDVHDLFTHISMQLYKPVRSTFTEMEALGENRFRAKTVEQPDTGRDLLALYTHRQWCRMLCLEVPWTLSVWLLDSGALAVNRAVPELNIVTAREADIPPQVVWQGRGVEMAAPPEVLTHCQLPHIF